MGRRLLIDTNMIQAEELEAFLASDPGHRAVMSSEIWFELYKQRCVDALRSGLNILGRYPDQLVVLRATGEIMRLDPSGMNLIERMALPDAARSIREMLAALDHAEDPAVSLSLKIKWDEAADQNQGMLEGAFDIIASLPEMQGQMFSANEIGIIRRNERYTHDMFGSIFNATEQLWETFSSDAGPQLRSPASAKASTLRFRIALGIVVYLLWWISKGSQSKKKPEATRNDLIDLLLAAHATYCDDFLSRDTKARWIYENLKAALEAYPNVQFV